MSCSKLLPTCAISQSNERLFHLKAIARSNCQNNLESVNFNKYGEKDNIGLESASDYFIDTVIISTSLDDTAMLCELESLSCMNLYKQNLMSLWKKYCGANSDYTLQPLFPIGEHEIKWKINCPSDSFNDVLAFLNSDEFRKYHKVLNIDITQDFAGSFDLSELILHLMENHDLKCGYPNDDPDNAFFYEKDMKNRTGLNCLNAKKNGVRYKAYLKFPQMMQNYKVRDDLGNRWYDWTQLEKKRSNSKFAQTRNQTCERGLTRIEVTVPGLQSAETLIQYIDNFLQMFPPELIYSTPHSAMWSAFCDCMKHTLIVCDEQHEENGTAIVIYGCNNYTSDLSGFIVNNWNAKKPHILDRYTLASCLPIHLIKVSHHSFIDDNLKTEIISLSGETYSKKMYFSGSDYTYISNRMGAFLHRTPTVSLTEFGFVPHRNCHLILPSKKLQLRSCRIAKIELVENFVPITFDFENATCEVKSNFTDYKSHSIDSETVLSMHDISILPTKTLISLEPGHYDIFGIIPTHNHYPFFVINIASNFCKVYGTKTLSDALNTTLVEAILSVTHTPIGTLTVLYHSRTKSKVKKSFVKVSVY